MALASYKDAGPAHSTLARALVQHGCPVDAVSSDGSFALEIAFGMCNLDLVVTLLESGASLQPPGTSQHVWLHNLVAFPNLDKTVFRPTEGSLGELMARAVRLFVAQGADPDALHEGFTPLLALCMVAGGFSTEAHLASLEELLDLGADANAIDPLGRTGVRNLLNLDFEQAAQLDEAALQRCCAAIAALARAGCDLNVVPHDGIPTPALHQAIYLAVKGCELRPEAGPGWVALLGTLLEAGADPGLVVFVEDRVSKRREISNALLAAYPNA